MSQRIEELIKNMTDEELVSEVMVWEFNAKLGKRVLEQFIKEHHVSSFFCHPVYTKEMILWIKNVIKKYTKTPILIAADVENGPFKSDVGESAMPDLMGCGAADDELLVFEMGKYTARICADRGISLAFSPVVDINYNFNNPTTNVRAVSDDPDRVLKIASAYSRGMRSEGRFATSAKHFPGDGTDDRNQHFCTSVNNMSMDEWRQSYGKVFSGMIADGVDAITVGHISLPSYGVEYDEMGPYPASISKRLITDLLKGELGFDGCVVSDAMSMIGVSSRLRPEKLAIAFFNAGGDMLLFPEKGDFHRVLAALHSGEIPRERMIDAVRRTMALKERCGLFDGYEYSARDEDRRAVRVIGRQIAEKSITLIRNYDNILPLKIRRDARILQINITYGKKNERRNLLPLFTEQLTKRGYEVDFMTNPTHYRVDAVVDDYDAVIICSTLSSRSSSGNSVKMDWQNVMAFWRGYALRNRKVVFISFGDPYKLYEMPYLRTYVNAYSACDTSVKAAVKACFGEIEFLGKSPVRLEGYFERAD
ncbi:MAG: glycoside hydrolase family 3 protein [Clostridia bacterium]|nr:glycoside hydrolase family 3 protein [Clostridia bacterium]